MKLTWNEIIEGVHGNLYGTISTDFAGITIDSRKVTGKELYFALSGENFDGHDFCKPALDKGAAAVVVGRNRCSNVTPRIEVDDPLHALQDIGGYIRQQSSCDVIAITGSHGKTTTKDILHSIFSRKHSYVHSTFQNLNGLIGVPVTLSKIKPETETVVIEVGISKPGEMARLAPLVKPTMAIFTCVANAHSEFLPTLNQIFEEKSHLMDSVTDQGPVILNGDDPVLRKGNRWSNSITYGLSENDFRGEIIESDFSGSKFTVTEPDGNQFELSLSIPGQHNVLNALAAITAARTHNISVAHIQEGLDQLHLSPHRSRVIKNGSFTIIDDVYNAAPQSMAAALSMLQEFPSGNRKIAILGDMLELGSSSEEAHKQLGSVICKLQPDCFVAFGDLMKEAVKITEKAGIMSFHFKTSDSVLDSLNDIIQEGDVILIKASRSMKGEKIVNHLEKA